MSNVREMADTAPIGSDAGGWIGRILARATSLPCPFRVHTPSGTTVVGDGEPEFDIYIHNDHGLRALKSLEELRIADAYVRGDLDIEGNVVKAMWLRDFLDDRNLWLKTLAPPAAAAGRPREAQPGLDREALRLEEHPALRHSTTTTTPTRPAST